MKPTSSQGKLNNGLAGAGARPTSSRPARTGLPAGPKSAEKDEVDEIYK